MKHILGALLMLMSTAQVFAQKNPTEEAQPIVQEGKQLFKSELASWIGTDLFLAEYKNRQNIGGYFSYTENDSAICVFFSRSEPIKIIGTIRFDSTLAPGTVVVSIEERDFSANETAYFKLRNAGIAVIDENKDDFFQFYKGTNFNVIPLITETERKMYVLTAPTASGVVLFGNDYLLTFDTANVLINKVKLHANLIPIEYGNEKEGEEIEGTVHNHLPETGDFITATDICTLMLYTEYTKWKTHNVVSEKYLNIWDCVQNTLVVVPLNFNEFHQDSDTTPEIKEE